MRAPVLPRIRGVLFDWDGTLVDSAEASLRCYRRLFESLGISYGRLEFERTYCPDWYRTYAALGLPEERWGEADAQWLALYSEETCALVPGAADAVRSLRSAGVACAVVTSGAGATRRSPSLGTCFRTGSRLARMRARPLALSRARSRGRGARLLPRETPRAAQAPVRDGFPNRAALSEAGPDLTADGLAEAAELLRGLATNRGAAPQFPRR